jgi:SH3 domain protein
MTTIATAETRYVSDTLVITVRELPDGSSTRIKSIVTDTPFEALEESGEYLKIRLDDGTEGYVTERYTTTSTPKPVLIEKLKSEKEKLQKQYDELAASLNKKEGAVLAKQKELQSTLDAVKKELAQLATEKKKLESDFANLDKEHATLKTNADNVVQIVNQSEKFRAENERLTIELESLQGENAMLLRTAVIKWVLTGAGILLIGWIMGKASRNKRRY